MLNFSHNKTNTNLNYPEIPHLPIRLKKIKSSIQTKAEKNNFSHTGYMMHGRNLTLLNYKCMYPLTQQFHS